MMGAGARRFAREERGTVMVLTIAFAIPLAMFLFASYNSGVAVLSRMRAQNVADAASYSAAIWQARFLNYCAYTRRHMVGNYATIALATCYVNSDKMYTNIWDADHLNLTWHRDSTSWAPPSVKNQMQPTYYALKGLIPVIKLIRQGSDHMNRWLDKSQVAMYLAVGMDVGPTIMKKVVEDASGRQDTNFELDLLMSHGSLAASALLDNSRKSIPKAEVKAYFDTYTKAELTWTNWATPISFLGRHDGWWGGWTGGYFPRQWVNEWTGFIMSINVKAAPVTIADSYMKTSHSVVWGTSWYVPVLFWVWTPWTGTVPVTPLGIWPIYGDNSSDKYDLQARFNNTKVYEIKPRSIPIEPGCFAVVKVDEASAPFYPLMGLEPHDLYGGAPIRAFSRAKVYFRGWQENLASFKYHGQNLNYPFWGAKLAAIEGDTVASLGAKALLGNRALLQSPEY